MRCGMTDTTLLLGSRQSTPISESPELTVIKSVVRQCLLTTEQEVERADRLFCDDRLAYLLYLTDGSRCILNCSPGLNTGVLRMEQQALENESRILNLLNRRTQIPVPQRIRYESGGNEIALRSPYLLKSHISGTPLSQLLSSISTADHAEIERATGVYYRILSSLTASSFGTPQAVSAGAGSASWREALLCMLEAVLRDAEDVLMSLPYDSIRQHFRSHAASLDSLPHPEPRLTAPSFCSANKVLVDEANLKISGLIGLDGVLWGDPEMAPVFQEPSSAFLNGYGSPQAVESSQRRQRLSIYKLYHAVVAVVKAHYRQQASEKELAARKDLTEGLNELASMTVA